MSDERNTTDRHRIVLVLGEPVVTDPRARAVLDRLVPPERQQLDLDVVRIPDEPLERVIESLAQVGMFGSGRGVWIRGLTTEPEQSVSHLLDFLSAPEKAGGLPESACVVATSQRLDQRSRLFKWFRANGEVIDLRVAHDRYGRLDKDQVADFIRRRIKAAGLEPPSHAVVALIAERGGEDVGQLAQEIDKLCLVCADSGVIDAKAVRAHLHDMGQAWIFDLTGALGRRDLGEAHRLLESLLHQGEPPLRLVATLSKQVARLIEASRVLPRIPPAAMRNMGAFARDYYPKLPPEVQQALGKNGFAAYHALQEAASFGGQELRAMHRELLEIDLRLKSSRLSPGQLFARFVQHACSSVHG